MSRQAFHVLIVDDDECICKTLSAILNAEGYRTTWALTAKDALERAKVTFFNVALLDIKIPDAEGTKLLAQLKEITPETVNIMITGYPSLQNAVEALNIGADSYIMKPIDPKELLAIIASKLEAQKQAEKITKEKLVDWVQLQVRRKQSSSFNSFLEKTAKEFKDFGLTENQAKTYTTILALGVAPVSEIASLSEIRREEIYRIVPKLKKQGIIIAKLDKPRKFSAVTPERAIQLLITNKLKTMKGELDKLRLRQAELISTLKTIELPTKQENCSMAIVSRNNLITKLIEMASNAKKQIDCVATMENLKTGYLNYSKGLIERLQRSIKMRMIVESHELDAFMREIIKFVEASNNKIKIRQVAKVLFNLMIVDGNEAMWGNPKDGSKQSFWTNDPTQIAVLNTSFESLWQGSSELRT